MADAKAVLVIPGDKPVYSDAAVVSVVGQPYSKFVLEFDASDFTDLATAVKVAIEVSSDFTATWREVTSTTRSAPPWEFHGNLWQMGCGFMRNKGDNLDPQAREADTLLVTHIRARFEAGGQVLGKYGAPEAGKGSGFTTGPLVFTVG